MEVLTNDVNKLALEEAKRLLEDPSYLVGTIFQNNPQGMQDAFHGVTGFEDISTPEAGIKLFNQILKEDPIKAAELIQSIPFLPENSPEYVVQAVEILYNQCS